MVKPAAVCCAVMLAAAIGSAPQRVSASSDPDAPATIRQQLADSGAFERIVVVQRDTLQLSDLVVRSDLVIEAEATSMRSSLDESETEIFTDYTFKVESILKNRTQPDLRPGSTVVVRRDSGEIVVDGRTAGVYENDFPAFAAGHYVLFLRERPNTHAYSVVGGGQGAFVVDENATSLATGGGEDAEARGPITRAAFLDEVRALLKFSR